MIWWLDYISDKKLTSYYGEWTTCLMGCLNDMVSGLLDYWEAMIWWLDRKFTLYGGWTKCLIGSLHHMVGGLSV